MAVIWNARAADQWIYTMAAKLIGAKTYTKSVVFTLVLLLAATLFWQPLLKFYNSFVFGPVLSKIISWWASDLAFGLAALLIFLFVVARARLFYRPGPRQLVTFMLPGAVHLFMRTKQSRFEGGK